MQERLKAEPTAVANFLRMRPSQPRAWARSRALASGSLTIFDESERLELMRSGLSYSQSGRLRR
jgi:hypothetical protein